MVALSFAVLTEIYFTLFIGKSYRRFKKKIHVGLIAQSCPTLCDSRSVAHQPPLSMGFPGQEN